ncbi:MAG: ABC transporter permease [Desulfuromusa sp.]|nr:ABC transporter permease [Desulfuromusa sp.]
MTASLYLAWQYVRFNKFKTIILVASITLIAVLPLTLEILLSESERQLLNRAESTPLLIGAKGSALDLAMNSLYFDDEIPEAMTMAAVERIYDTDLALPIPLYVRFQARGLPIVGTSFDYFDFRKLSIAQGRSLTMLGDCVLGAKAAEKLDLGPGDTLVSSPENLFDLAGVYPLKMKVVGVLAPNHSADDLAVLVDIKTAWVIQGLGHGHKDVTRTRDSTVVLKRTEGNVAANAKLFHYTEIDTENLDSFHFHGNTSSYPVTAVIAVPHDEKSGTLLRGRYLKGKEPHQIIRPAEVIDGLLQNIFRIRNVLDAVIAIVGLATILTIVLVFTLSLRLRQREVQTIFKLGCRKATIARMLLAEVGIIILASGALCAVFVGVVDNYAEELVRHLFVG